jgi:pimeloyl-[acyl-carrier protein] methyl ester esterase
MDRMSELAIQRHGHGAIDFVLLHGWAMHGGMFAPLTAALAEHATVHVVDLPGHGYSRDSDLPLTPRVCARAIAKATPPAIWLGWSLGGLIALTAALDHPAQVQSLVMLCASPCFVRKPDWNYGMAPEGFAAFSHELEADYHAALERFLALEAMGSAHANADMRRLRKQIFARGEPDQRVLGEGITILDQTDLRPRLSSLTCPSTWIAGGRDRLVPWRAMAWAAAHCGGQFTRIDHAGHAPFIGFSPQVAGAIAPLMAATERSRQPA